MTTQYFVLLLLVTFTSSWPANSNNGRIPHLTVKDLNKQDAGEGNNSRNRFDDANDIYTDDNSLDNLSTLFDSSGNANNFGNEDINEKVDIQRNKPLVVDDNSNDYEDEDYTDETYEPNYNDIEDNDHILDYSVGDYSEDEDSTAWKGNVNKRFALDYSFSDQAVQGESYFPIADNFAQDVPYDSNQFIKTNKGPDFSKGLSPQFTEGKNSREEDNNGVNTSWFSSLANDLGEARKKVSSFAKNSFHTLGENVKDTASGIGDSFTDSFNAIRGKWKNLKEKSQAKFPQIWAEFKQVLTKFGLLVQKGAKIVVERIRVVYDDIHGSQLIAKLEKKLEEGDEQVTKFFQKVGEKVTAWMDQHNHQININQVDDGLDQVHQVDQALSQHLNDPKFPDLFQDREIQEELQKLVQEGIIQQQDIDKFTQQTNKVFPDPKQDQGFPGGIKINHEVGITRYDDLSEHI